MLKGLRPPTHRVDAPGVLILASDNAWDFPRIEAEQAALEAEALRVAREEARAKFAAARGVDVSALTDEQISECDGSVVLTEAEREQARNAHPVARYLRGETRFQPEAPDQGPEGPTCAAAYLKPGEVPARFVLRRVPALERARIEVERDLFAGFARWVRAGVCAVDAGDVQWRAELPTDRIPDDLFEVICESGEGPAITLISLAAACKRYSEPLTESEGKR